MLPHLGLSCIIRGACSIELEETVILTGGSRGGHGETRVTVYNTDGYVEDLPSLNAGRFDHGCGHFVNNENQMVRQ